MSKKILLLPLAALVVVCVLLPHDPVPSETGRRLLSAPTSALRKLLQFVIETSGSFTMSNDGSGGISTSGSFTIYTPQSEFVEPKKKEEGPKNKDSQLSLVETVAPATGCKKDADCMLDGDMGGYCKANKDCHCTAPFFASDGTTCKLSCTPTSKPTACCRDDTDCQAGGDKAAYCKSPRSNHHTSPGNGQCRCGIGWTGTTSCHKDKDQEELMQVHEALRVDGIALYLCSLLAMVALFFMVVRSRRAQYDVVILEDQYKNLMTSEHQI